MSDRDKMRSGQEIAGGNAGTYARAAQAGEDAYKQMERGPGVEVPTIYSLNCRVEEAQRRLQNLMMARQFLQTENPTGEQIALGLTVLRAVGYQV